VLDFRHTLNEYDLPNSAVFSEDGRYRYILGRDWEPFGRTIVWIMLNPSIGNEFILESTTAGCMTRAQKWGYAGMIVLNLFALIETDPEKLKRTPEAIGPLNNKVIESINLQAPEDSVFIAAWGNHGKHLGRDIEVTNMLNDRDLYCLGTNKNGTPRHPLHMSHSIRPELWRGAGEFCL
jgi:hypothetical protein